MLLSLSPDYTDALVITPARVQNLMGRWSFEVAGGNRICDYGCSNLPALVICELHPRPTSLAAVAVCAILDCIPRFSSLAFACVMD